MALKSSSLYVDDVVGMAKKYVTNFVLFLQSITSNKFNFLPTKDKKGKRLLLELTTIGESNILWSKKYIQV